MRRILSFSLIFLAFLGLFPVQLSYAQCKESQIRTQKYIETGFVMEMRNDYREWYVDRDVWSYFTFSQKEQAVKALSAIRYKCDGYLSIKVFDGHTGETLAKRGSFGIKIFK